MGAPRIIERKALILFDGSIDLDSGKEWHSKPISLKKGDDLSVTGTSPARFYAGLFDEAQYDRLRGSEPGAFPFPFGKDERLFDQTFRIAATTKYILVFRRGVFSDAGPIQVRVVRTLATVSI